MPQRNGSHCLASRPGDLPRRYVTASGLFRFRDADPPTPDLRPSNILHLITGFDGLSEDQVLGILGEPPRNPVLNRAGEVNNAPTAPGYLVYPVNWDTVDKSFFVKSPQLIDFGESFDIASDLHRGLGIPGPYQSPELLLEAVARIPSDLWVLGCTLFEIRTGRRLFCTLEDEDDSYLEAMCDILGKLPEPWWSTTWESRRAIFKDDADENGRVVTVYEPKGLVHRNVDPSSPPELRSLMDMMAPGLGWRKLA